MQNRLIQTVEGRMLRTDGEMANAIVAFEARGYQHTGFNQNAHNRAELQGQPTFDGLAGPMWDGDAIRYEDWAAYRALSE